MDLLAAAGRGAPVITVTTGRKYATQLAQRTLSVCSGDVERLAAGKGQLVSERKSVKCKAGVGSETYVTGSGPYCLNMSPSPFFSAAAPAAPASMASASTAAAWVAQLKLTG